MFNWLLGKMSNDEYGSRERMTNVGLEIWYNEESDEFIVGYGVTNSVDLFGRANTVSEAFSNLSESVELQRKHHVNTSAIESSSKCGLEVEMYLLTGQDDYLVKLTDCDDNFICGVGHTSNTAFDALAKEVCIKKDES